MSPCDSFPSPCSCSPRRRRAPRRCPSPPSKGSSTRSPSPSAPDGKLYVSVIGEFDKDGDGSVVVIDQAARPSPFVAGLDDPKGIALFQNWLYVTDKTKVLRIDATAKEPKAEVVADADEVPRRRRCSSTTSSSTPRAARCSSATPATQGQRRRGVPPHPAAPAKGKGPNRAAEGRVKIDVVVDAKKLPGLQHAQRPRDGRRSRTSCSPTSAAASCTA